MREAIYRFGDVEVEPGGREVRRAGRRVPLEPKALDVLLLLLAEPGRVVEKRRLLRDVWADVHVTDSSLARAITQVRRALGDDIRMPRFIETVPTRGYRFIGALEDEPATVHVASPPPAFEAAVATTSADETRVAGAPPWPRGSREPASTVSTSVRRMRWVRVAMVPFAVSAIALASLLSWRGVRSQAAAADLGEVLVSAVTHAAVQVTTSRGLDADPALSPDGRSIAYASDSSGSLEIYVRPRIASGTTRAVTANGGDNVAPAWSPDGQWLAYHSRRLGGIWLVPAAGGPARQLVTDGASPAWSQDGRSIVFQTAGEADILGGAGGSRSTLSVLHIATGAVEPLTHRGSPAGSHGSPVWVPGHDSVVFVAARVPGAEVWQVSRAGRLTRLGACHATCRPFTFARAGTAWAGVVRGAKDGQLWLAPVAADGVVDMTRARMTPLPRVLSVTDVSVSLDGTQMAFTNAERTSEAWALDPGDRPGADIPTPRVLLGERRPRYGEFAVSFDGTQLAFTTSRLGDREEPWLFGLTTGVARPLGLAVNGYVKGWERGDQAVASISADAGLVVRRLELATGRATNVLSLDRWAGLPDVSRRLFTLRLSPDWRQYFYTADVDGELGVWLADVDGRVPDRRVARTASFGAWSSDGRQMALQIARGWRSSIGVVSPGSRDVRLLVTDADHAWPNGWSPDDRHIVYAALRRGRWALESVEVATGRVRRLTAPGAAAEYVRWPVWSPRGDLIVYERGYWTGNVWVAAVPNT
jgi:Tol biopolymer transport system component/DNA-binding winged helix-turn-helix (wHTH) protein